MNKDLAVGQVVDTTSFASTIPQVDGLEISRDNILQTVKTMLDGREVRSVHIEGQSGAGKSILLAQFAKAHCNRTISVFARRSSWFTYDPAILLHDLAAQMFWLAEGKVPQFSEEISDVTLRGLLFKLRTYSIRIGKPLILILDGISDIPDDQSDLRRLLMEKLPFGLDYIKLLTSSSPTECRLTMGVREWLIPPFSAEESLAYFDGILSPELVRVVHKTCGGTPGFLAGIRRLVESGIAGNALLAELPNSVPEIFAIEWRFVDVSNTLLCEALGLLAHDSNKHTLLGLSDILECRHEQLRLLLSKLRFIVIPSNDDGEYPSEQSHSFHGTDCVLK
ncbi:MAG: NACHT domain-containing protein [Puia sp.]|nr:NACHT domain-containing protein [Puia sp.]